MKICNGLNGAGKMGKVFANTLFMERFAIVYGEEICRFAYRILEDTDPEVIGEDSRVAITIVSAATVSLDEHRPAMIKKLKPDKLAHNFVAMWKSLKIGEEYDQNSQLTMFLGGPGIRSTRKTRYLQYRTG